MAAPILPVELEREIFEMTAHSRPLATLMLMLVASRVKIWVEPLLYRTIVLTSPGVKTLGGHPKSEDWETFTHLMQAKPLHLIQNSVRNLFISHVVSATHLEWFLSTCSRIETLCMFHVNLEHHLSAIGNLKPKRIHCELRHIFEPDAQINLTHPSFSEVTHLELFDVLPSAAWSRLSLMPHLAHLALNDIPSDPFFRLVHDACASLHVLILLDMGPGDLPEPPEDPRIVLMNCHDYTKD